ncbi:hypothetical protein BD410DRAFT_795699 [Rickenella mellea]|uniref:Uncharacterized protein n=1 Tax=Rickenella mellea TaxID=50990 RepID=A0A4Y7PL19_9AGAM|nr:hypothetical protein BD410DRAFT_795699 [Rickenella mellea]
MAEKIVSPRVVVVVREICHEDTEGKKRREVRDEAPACVLSQNHSLRYGVAQSTSYVLYDRWRVITFVRMHSDTPISACARSRKGRRR